MEVGDILKCHFFIAIKINYIQQYLFIWRTLSTTEYYFKILRETEGKHYKIKTLKVMQIYIFFLKDLFQITQTLNDLFRIIQDM